MSLEIRVLGPLEAQHDGTVLALPAGRVRELLLRLVVAGSSALSVERLAADLWPESGGRTTTSTVRTYVARLRGALPDGVIQTRADGYALDRGAAEIDADRFERDLRRATALAGSDPRTAADVLAVALDTWRGPALADVAAETWAAAAAAHLEALRLDALELHAQTRLDAGNDAAAIAGDLRELTRQHPLRERLWKLRMLALYRAGRQAEALACYQELRATLAEELGIDPSADVRDLERAILAQDPSLDPRPAPASAPGPAPEAAALPRVATSLVGRHQEITDVLALLPRAPLVTLTGPGGVGKSRLADEIAAISCESRRCVIVELAPAASRDDVLAVVGAALGITRRGSSPMIDVLASTLASTDVLLVLDNCEHVAADVAALAGRLVAEAPRVNVLATSREPLGVLGEATFAVAPLTLPAASATADEIRAADAVRLFAGRARVVSPGFTLDDDEDAATVARICRRLDGLPFAIELAAARMRVLTPSEVELRLDERFGLLTRSSQTDARHETLREAIAWSYELLDERERSAFRSLSLFVGSFDMEGATAVCALDDAAVVDVVANLIDRSILNVDRRDDRVRYSMLDTVRAFGRERLEAEGELVSAHDRHARHLARLAERTGTLLHGPDEKVGHQQLAAARDDLQAAFEWCLVGSRWDDAARIVAEIPWERVGRSLQWDLARWAIRLIEEEPVLPARLHARVLATATVGYWLAGDAETARRRGDAALARADDADDATAIEVALAVAWMRWESGDTADAVALYAPLATPALAGKVRDDVAAYCLAGIAMGMTELGVQAEPAGAAELDALSAAALELAEASGCPTSLALAHLARGYSLLDRDVAAAAEHLEVAARTAQVAVPSWGLHARAHLARLRVAAGDAIGLERELADLLTTALAAVDDMHLRLLAGFAGAALAMADRAHVAPGLGNLAAAVFADAAGGWRAEAARAVTETQPRADREPGGAELEQAVRGAVEALTAVSAVPR